ncbi:MAG: hypothetical protein PVS3B1_26490 [Ktedonobacteraceae bacterium]
MERERCFEIMAQGPREPLVALADRLLIADGESNGSGEGNLEIIKEPKAAVLMVRARDTAQGEIFNFGEALVTEAEVRFSGETGYMLVLGDDQMHALAGAICDAALQAGHRASPDILETLTMMQRLQQEKSAAEWASVAPTTVAFDEMEA